MSRCHFRGSALVTATLDTSELLKFGCLFFLASRPVTKFVKKNLFHPQYEEIPHVLVRVERGYFAISWRQNLV